MIDDSAVVKCPLIRIRLTECFLVSVFYLGAESGVTSVHLPSSAGGIHLPQRIHQLSNYCQIGLDSSYEVGKYFFCVFLNVPSTPFKLK